MPIVHYRWFPLGTDYLATELLVTLLGLDTCYFAALELNGPQLVESRILEEVSIDLFRLFIRFFSYLIELKLCEGRAEVMESYQQTVKERCALIKDMHMNWSSARVLECFLILWRRSLTMSLYHQLQDFRITLSSVIQVNL